MSRLREQAEQRIKQLLGVSDERATRVVSEVLDCFRYQVDEYISVRHAELSAQGMPNVEIYDLIADELPTLPFRVTRLSARQIRRRIYG